MAEESKDSPAESEPIHPTCGMIMPISALDGCPEAHWKDVREIFESAIEDANFEPQMVSDADDIGIIQKRIIQNIYNNPIIVCDVSGKNPNVMFELGMRLAFDKPTIIVKDDKTEYSFDTSPIEHLEYPRDLRFPKIVDFQGKLSEKIQGTHEKATTDQNFTTFLKNFGSFSVPSLETKEVSKEDYIIEELNNLKSLITRVALKPESPRNSTLAINRRRPLRFLCLPACTEEQLPEITSKLRERGFFPDPQFHKTPDNHYHINIEHLSDEEKTELLKIVLDIYKDARLIPGRIVRLSKQTV